MHFFFWQNLHRRRPPRKHCSPVRSLPRCSLYNRIFSTLARRSLSRSRGGLGFAFARTSRSCSILDFGACGGGTFAGWGGACRWGSGCFCGWNGVRGWATPCISADARLRERRSAATTFCTRTRRCECFFNVSAASITFSMLAITGLSACL